ncbi:InlB B-repeat-containing protein [Cellulophaga baltica]|uniref:InlB B-repeat-containing protein n=1 Tax=Cellulophaga baltica TaxID=76594 RepID=UPI003F4AF1D6
MKRVLIAVVSMFLLFSCDKTDETTTDGEMFKLDISFDEKQGSVEVTPKKEAYLSGETVTITVVEKEGYAFLNWEGLSDDQDSTKTEIIVTINADIAIKALFEAAIEEMAYKLAVNFNDSEGVVTISPMKDGYNSGEDVLLTASPKSGYTFSKWTGTMSGDNSELTVVMDKDHEVTAVFKADVTTDASSILLKVDALYNISSKKWDFSVELKDKSSDTTITDVSIKINDTPLVYNDFFNEYDVLSLEEIDAAKGVDVVLSSADLGTLNYTVPISSFSGTETINAENSADNTSVTIDWQEVVSVDAYRVFKKLIKSGNSAVGSTSVFSPFVLTNTITVTYVDIFSGNTGVSVGGVVVPFDTAQLWVAPVNRKDELENLDVNSYIEIVGKPSNGIEVKQ